MSARGQDRPFSDVRFMSACHLIATEIGAAGLRPALIHVGSDQICSTVRFRLRAQAALGWLRSRTRRGCGCGSSPPRGREAPSHRADRAVRADPVELTGARCRKRAPLAHRYQTSFNLILSITRLMELPSYYGWARESAAWSDTNLRPRNRGQELRPEGLAIGSWIGV